MKVLLSIIIELLASPFILIVCLIIGLFQVVQTMIEGFFDFYDYEISCLKHENPLDLEEED